MLSKLLAPLLENKLTKQQKHATAILSIGTFLEYFDLYLYIHMAFIIDPLFFPSDFGISNWFFANLALCSTFIFRPVGAIILGWLGDNLGRKSTIFISTTATSICCLIIYYLPPYEKIGPIAAYSLVGCRLVQGMLSSAEMQGAKIYLMEIAETTVNKCYLSCLVGTITVVGRLAAIGVASFFINVTNQSWRNVFLAGAAVALVGAYARSSLKETPEFADAKRRLKKSIEALGGDVRKSHPLFAVKLDKKDYFYLFILKCGEVLAMYFAYSYCSHALSNLGCSEGQCINYSTLAAIYEIVFCLFLIILVFYVNPLKIVNFLVHGATVCFILVPILLHNFASPNTIFLSQILLLTFMVSDYPASPLFYKRFPVLQRFTSILMISALSRAITWPISTFLIRYLTEKVFGHYGLYIIFLPMSVLSIMAVRHFIEATEKDEELKKQAIKNANFQNV